jgi:hypothetical protein
MSATETVNLRAPGGNPPASAKLIGTAELPVPAQRYPDDESFLAPLISVDFGEGGIKLFQYVSGSFSFGGMATPEYQEVVPVVLTLKPVP